MKAIQSFVFFGISLLVWRSTAAPVINVSQGEEGDLAATYSSIDLIQGMIATEMPGDLGWHSANKDPADQLPAFTDGTGIRASGLTGLLSDFPGAGNPAKRIRYTLPAPADIQELRVFTGNNGRDGRVFHTYTVRFYVDGGQSSTPIIYVQSHASGTVNNTSVNNWRVVLSQLTDTSGLLAARVTHLDLDFFSVDNTGGEMRDPYGGVNPLTGFDDALSAAFVSPLVWEIDVLGQYSAPILTAARAGNSLTISWVGLTNGAALQAATNLTTPAWLDLSPQPAIAANGNTNTAQVLIEPGTKYFRVRY